MQAKNFRLLMGAAMAGSVSMLALTGCPAPGTGTNSNVTLSPTQATTASSAVDTINDVANFSADPSTELANLSSADDTSGGSGSSTLAVFSVADATGSYTNGYPANAPTSLADATTSLGTPTATRNITWAKGSIATEVYSSAGYASNTGNWNPFPAGTMLTDYAWANTVIHNDSTVDQEFVTPAATASGFTTLPSPFNGAGQVANSYPVLPSAGGFRQYALDFLAYGGKGATATGWRYEVFQKNSSGYVLYAWDRALQIDVPAVTVSNKTFPAQTIDQWDIATNYQAVPSNYGFTAHRVPFERIVDKTNVSSNTHWHNDETFTNGVWTGNGTFTNASGSVYVINTTLNPTTLAHTKTISWTNASNLPVVVTEDSNPDRSGTGTIAINGATVANLAWTSNGTGTLTINGEVKPFHVH